MTQAATTDTTVLKQLAATLPDIPRWVKLRSMLMNGTCEVLGLEEGPDPSFAAINPYTRMTDQMGRQRKRPVWSAEEPNVASMQLASKLGFKPVDRRFVLRAPAGV